jgi:glycolate oxidase iron-sulfur subunit
MAENKLGVSLPEKIKQEIENCNQCGKCLAVCPTYWVTADECDSARGLLELIRNVYTGKLTISGKYLNHLFLCLSCRACTEVCPSNIALNEVFDWAKSQYAVCSKQYAGFSKIPFSATTQVWEEYLRKQLTQKQKSTSFLSSIPEKVGRRNGKHRVGFFVGCLMDIGYQKTAESIVEWLVNHHYEVIIPKEQGCCGMPGFSLGDTNSARDLINKNIEVYKNYGIKTIITGCAHCAFMVRNKWGILSDSVPFKIEHIAEIMGKIGVNQIPIRKSKNWVGYQPACLLHRGLGVSPNINKLFTKPLNNYVEVKNAVTCCGQAGISGFLFPAVAKEIASRQMKKYAQVKIDYLLTNCPWCNLIYEQQKAMQYKTVSLSEFIQGEK